MKRIVGLIFFISGFFSESHAQGEQARATHKIVYSGYINFSAALKPQPNLNNIVLVGTERAVSWNELASDFKAVDNDSVITIAPADKMLSPVYKNYNADKIAFQYRSAFLQDNKNFFADDLFPMQWTITSRTKKIDSMDCIKALTIFRGRAYAAWFNPKIAIREGPWKFGGLPGLIIQLYDEERSIFWSLASFGSTDVLMPAVPQSKGDYQSFKKEYTEGFKRFALANQSAQGIDPSCSTCSKEMEVKVETIENILD